MILVRSIPSHIPTISASATFPSCPYPKEHVEEGGDVPLLQLDLGSDRTRLSGDEFLEIAYRIRRETFDSDCAWVVVIIRLWGDRMGKRMKLTDKAWIVGQYELYQRRRGDEREKGRTFTPESIVSDDFDHGTVRDPDEVEQ